MSENEKFEGVVVWFSPKEGYGFINWSKNGVQQKDMFFHYSDIVCEGFKTVFKEQKVSFGLGVNKHGKPKAIEITVLKH
jgi:CspA family cold shock protein